MITENTTSVPPQTTEAPAETEQSYILKRVESVDYKAEISGSISDLMNSVLTQQEKEMVNSGSMLEILLTMDKIDSVSDNDNKAVKEALDDYKVGQYIDVNLYKIIDGTQYKLNNTNDSVTIKINIPEVLRKPDREFAIMRIHNGVADIINAIDSSEDTVTFATDRFSVYALIYKDKSVNNENTSAANKNNTVNEDAPMNTGVDSYTSVFLAAGITAMSAAMVFTVMGTGIIGMSEENKNKMYDKLIRWGKGGGKARRAIALALVFILLSYYYGIGVRAREKAK